MTIFGTIIWKINDFLKKKSEDFILQPFFYLCESTTFDIMKISGCVIGLIIGGKEVAKVKNELIRIIPLGGVGEIGKAMYVVEIDEEIFVVDSGLMFPEDEMLGIDIVIPDITYIEENKDRVKGIFLTHGHEDAIGSIAYLIAKSTGASIWFKIDNCIGKRTFKRIAGTIKLLSFLK